MADSGQRFEATTLGGRWSSRMLPLVVIAILIINIQATNKISTTIDKVTTNDTWTFYRLIDPPNWMRKRAEKFSESRQRGVGRPPRGPVKLRELSEMNAWTINLRKSLVIDHYSQRPRPIRDEDDDDDTASNHNSGNDEYDDDREPDRDPGPENDEPEEDDRDRDRRRGRGQSRDITDTDYRQWEKFKIENDDITLGFGVPECGLNKKGRTLSDRIINGTAVKELEIPWIAFLAFSEERSVFCGASILTPRWLLTASHCLYDANSDTHVPAKDIQVGVGSILVKDAIMYDVDQVVIHEKFKPKPYHLNDIALVHTTEDIDFSKTKDGIYEVNAFCMPEKDSEVEGLFTIAGWGTINTEIRRASEELMKTEIETVRHRNCADLYEEDQREQYPEFVFPSTAFCGKGADESKPSDSCQGDSGGPAYALHKEAGTQQYRAILVGVVSFGVSCADNEFPGAYTQVSKFIPWINSYVHGDRLVNARQMDEQKMAEEKSPKKNSKDLDFDLV